MNKFFFFDSYSLSHMNSDRADTFNQLFSTNKWLKLHGIRQWPNSVSARTHALDTPWTICRLSDIPTLDNNVCEDFTTVIDSIVADYCTEILNSNRQVYVYWSGGIDSTSILVAFLKNASPAILDKITVVCDQNSIVENPYFYYKFVEPRFHVVDTYVDINNNNYQNLIVLDGELGDQCMYGNDYIYQLAVSKRFDLLRGPWKNAVEHCVIKAPGQTFADDGTVKFAMDLIVESIGYSPVNITSLYDFLWWTQFNFKWDENILRKLTLYTGSLGANERKYFYEQCLWRVYEHPRMQQWSMLTLEKRMNQIEVGIKYDVKKYIYDFDKNDFYFAHRTKLHSGQDWNTETFNFGPRTLAIDDKWTELQLANRSDRRTIAEILQKIAN